MQVIPCPSRKATTYHNKPIMISLQYTTQLLTSIVRYTTLTTVHPLHVRGTGTGAFSLPHYSYKCPPTWSPSQLPGFTSPKQLPPCAMKIAVQLQHSQQEVSLNARAGVIVRNPNMAQVVGSFHGTIPGHRDEVVACAT